MHSIIGLDNASIGEILKENGYATSWFGKNHNTPAFQYGVAGPFDLWPSGMGFEYFYGFMGGETDQWEPYLFRDHTQIFPWIGRPGYNLTTENRSLRTKKRAGVIPANAKLTAWPDSLAKWDTLSADEKKLFARQAEVYAAYTAYTDHEIGRVIQAVQDLGKLDDTLIIYIDGDTAGQTEFDYSGLMPGIPNANAPNILARSYTITAEVEVPHGVDTRTGVNDKDYQVPFAFNGTIDKLTVKIGPSQLSGPEQKTAAAAAATAKASD